jgi:hypothetical protein
MIEFVLAATIAWVDAEGGKHERQISDPPHRTQQACMKSLNAWLDTQAQTNGGIRPIVIGGQACQPQDKPTSKAPAKRSKAEQDAYNQGAEAMKRALAEDAAKRAASAPGR